jgi:hypothetical protein
LFALFLYLIGEEMLGQARQPRPGCGTGSQQRLHHPTS